jgi:acetyltransferase
MVPRGNARQLFIGAATDPLFGPIILFGEGGRAAELFRDLAVGLPPLNVPLAQELVARTRVATLLKEHLNRPAANLDAVCLTLMQVSQLIADVPELLEMDINPLFADDRGVTVVDARMKVAAVKPDPNRLAVRPYPKWLEETILLRDGRAVLLRPIRPEDEPAHHVFISKLTPEDMRFRFFHYKASLPHSEMARLTQIDYDREMAFIAIVPDAHGQLETLGVIRVVTDPDNRQAEFSMVTRSDLKGQGLGTRMMRKMMDYCRNRGTLEMTGDVLTENAPMLSFLGHFGFTVAESEEEGVLRVSYRLN